MKSRLQLRADQLFATGLLECQVDNSWFLPIEPFNEALHVLMLSIDISETLMNCNLQGVEVNGHAKRCANLVLAAVTAADSLGLVVVAHPMGLQGV